LKKFKFGLQPVLSHRQFIEETLQKELARLQRRLAKERDRLDHHKDKQRHLTAELEQEQRQGTNSSTLLLYSNFLEQLAADIQQQTHKVTALVQQTDAKREELLDAMKNRKALEKFKEKKLAEHTAMLAKKEQAFLDEIGSSRHGRKQA
jgi:flagellar FliJ protein